MTMYFSIALQVVQRPLKKKKEYEISNSRHSKSVVCIVAERNRRKEKERQEGEKCGLYGAEGGNGQGNKKVYVDLITPHLQFHGFARGPCALYALSALG